MGERPQKLTPFKCSAVGCSPMQHSSFEGIGCSTTATMSGFLVRRTGSCFAGPLDLPNSPHISDALYFVRTFKSPEETLLDYVASSRDNRRIFFRHGPRLAGRLDHPPTA